MSKSVQPIVDALFGNGSSEEKTIVFHWRLIKRRGWPFLLLPESGPDSRTGLELYSAQRPLAKLWRAFLPFLLKTPAASLFPRVTVRTHAGSPMIRFLAEQSGMPAEQLRAPAIKFGGLAENKSRLVLLLCDETRRPVKVIKTGLDAGGRAATERESRLLEKLPPHIIGCIRMSGQLMTDKLSAFATPYFPGQCPEDDAGMEILFHSWLNPMEPVVIEMLDSWKMLEEAVAKTEPEAWQTLRPALAGHKVRSSLHHGDFAPWNIRAINTQNLQAFDWEYGHHDGIPGWDWFHFFVQTSILARRHSVERVAAEVEELLASPRFQKYAAAAGISSIVKPLLLAYLLHQRCVIKPLEGGSTAAELFDLLAARWHLDLHTHLTLPSPSPPGNLWASALQQLKCTATQMGNLFWEPTLISRTQPTMAAQFLAYWPNLLVALLLVAAVAGTHYLASTHLIFLPFYLAPIVLVTVRMDRRWGAVIATVAAIVGPLIQSYKDAEFHHMEVVLWNIIMRFVMLQMCVLFVDRIRRQKNILTSPLDLRPVPARFSDNWAVIVFCVLLFAAIFLVDFATNPHWNFIPVYLIPCMLLTLRLNFKWGLLAAALTSLAGSLSEFWTNPGYKPLEVFGWNCLMRFLISAVIIVLLERIRRENVLFFSRNVGGKTGHR